MSVITTQEITSPEPDEVAEPATRTSPVTRRGYRRDIQGLRAIAVGSVVLYHAGATWLPGGYVGVDVFFVISGFLITGGLVKEAVDGRISLSDFYARRARRILPAASLTIVSVGVIAWTVLPPIRRASIGWDSIASALYYENWRLAFNSTDYLTATQAPSPLQHFWSLAVEEQFYLFWPLLLLAASAVAASFPRRWLRPTLFAAVVLVLIPSLYLSVTVTSSDPATAYFVTHTRLWELAIGAALAIASTVVVRMPAAVGAFIAWAGIAAIAYSAATFTDATPFPGWHALVPTVGTAAAIAGGLAGARLGPGMVIGLRPFTFLGDISYSYYLWHWPLLVAATAMVDDLTFEVGLITALIALVPAYLSLRLVEQPIQFGEWFRHDHSRAFLVGLFATASSVAVGFVLVWSMWPPAPERTGPNIEVSQPSTFNDTSTKYGAMALGADPATSPAGRAVDHVADIYPDIEVARTDIGGCASLLSESKPEPCVYGSNRATVQVALVGDSHAAQWAPALNEAAKRLGWTVTEYTKQNCPLSTGRTLLEGVVDDSCLAWNEAVQAQLSADPPDVLLVSNVDRPMEVDGTNVFDEEEAGGQADEALAAAMTAAWRPLEDEGTQVVALKDTPRPNIDIPDCISAHRDELRTCAFPRIDEGYGDAVEAAARTAGTPLIDLNEAICPSDPCAAVVGQYIVYADTNHITAHYSATLGPRLRAALERVVGSAH